MELARVPLDDAFGHWLAGFIDGEGCFLIGEFEGRYHPTMVLKLRDDDRVLLDEIVECTGVGYVRDRKAQGNSRPCTAWHVGSQADCVALVDLLDAYPMRSRKARDYAVWRRAVAVWVAGRRGQPERWNRLARLAAELRLARTYVPPSPRPAESIGRPGGARTGQPRIRL